MYFVQLRIAPQNPKTPVTLSGIPIKINSNMIVFQQSNIGGTSQTT